MAKKALRGIGNYQAGAHIHSLANDKLIYGIQGDIGKRV